MATSEYENEYEYESKSESKNDAHQNNYISVDGVLVTDPEPCMTTYVAALNARQKEHNTRNWREVLPEWFRTNLQINFNDDRHVFNSFSRFLIEGSKTSNGVKSKKVITYDDVK